MKSLYIRIYATLVVVLLLFALVAGWIFSRNMAHRRAEFDAEIRERVNAWADLAMENLPAASTSEGEQREALIAWSARLGVPMALDDAGGKRIATSTGFAREEERARTNGGQFFETFELPLSDGRILSLVRHGPLRPPGPSGRDDRFREEGGGRGFRNDAGRPPRDERSAPPDAASSDEAPSPRFGQREGAGGRGDRPPLPFGPGPGFGPGGPGGPGRPGDGGPRLGPPSPWWFASTTNLVAALVVLFVAVAAGAWPVVRRLTRRLEALKQGVEAFGAGALDQRVRVDGNDEVAALAVSFNQAAGQIETLVRSHQSLLANASHELRSPLARMKMALSLIEVVPEAQRPTLKREIDTNIAELDSLVEEVLLASRLDASDHIDCQDRVDLLALAAEEADRVQALADGDSAVVTGNERLLRRALRNLLENAKRYGGDDVATTVAARAGEVELRVCDRGSGVPEALRERIFEPFYRLPGHAEQAGGVGLGLSLVRQIAERHHGSVHCEAREGGGSCFVIRLPQGQGGAAK